MTSKSVEDAHLIMLNKVLSESGLECTRSYHESSESLSSSRESVEEEIRFEEEEAILETAQEQEMVQEIEAVPEEQPYVFPTPSLRRLIPDRIRGIEEASRIHVLPEVFRTDIDPAAIPKIATTAQQKYINILAEMLGCTKYKSSLAEYWFLDTMANLLRRAQEDELDRPTQAILMMWFCEWMKEMQHFDAADRKRMVARFQENMLAAAKFIAEETRLPTPAEAGVTYKSPEELLGHSSHRSTAPVDSKHLVTFEGAAYECCLRDLTKIIHYIFDLFSSDYQYNLVRSVFTFTPDYQLIDTPYQLQNPKRLYAPLKLAKEKSPKKEAKVVSKGKKKEPDTEEYLALLELKAREERELEERDQMDRELWHRRRHVLPLSFAADDSLLDKYWPPPPEPEPEPVPDPKGKAAKGKGKK